jgi:hypothetical protein
MNPQGLESFQLHFNRQGPAAGVSVTFSSKVGSSVQDIFAFWKDRRSEILSLPTVAGLSIAPDGEDMSIAINKRTITGTIRFSDPPTPTPKKA